LLASLLLLPALLHWWPLAGTHTQTKAAETSEAQVAP